MAKLSAAMQGLKNFLTNEAMMSKDKAGQYVRDLRKVDGFDDSVAKDLTSHLRDKLDASFQGQSHDDPDSLKQFLNVNNLGGEIWQRGKRNDELFNQWKNHNFLQYNNLNNYSQYYNDALRKALNGKKVDYDDIGHRLQQDAIKKAELDGSERERLASIGNRQKEALEKEQRERDSRQQAIDRDRQNVAILMNESPDSDAVIAATNNIRQNSPLGSVVLENSARPLRQAAEQKQAAIDLFNTDVETQKQILKEYFNKTGIKEDKFNKILEKANMTDDEITKRAIESSSNEKIQEKNLNRLRAKQQFANDPTMENFKSIGLKNVQDDAAQDFVENFQRYKALKQEDEIRQKISNGSWGSGKNLQETAGSAQDQAVASAASDFSSAFPSFEKAMSGDGNVSLDRAILRSKMGGDPSDWGFEGGSNHLLTNQEKDFNKFIKDLRKSNASPEQKQKLFNDKLFEIQKNIAEGPGMSDFFFGNQLHTGAIGAAAIMGTMGVAFGGRKSNAELYSSPF